MNLKHRMHKSSLALNHSVKVMHIPKYLARINNDIVPTQEFVVPVMRLWFLNGKAECSSQDLVAEFRNENWM